MEYFATHYPVTVVFRGEFAPASLKLESGYYGLIGGTVFRGEFAPASLKQLTASCILWL